MKKKIKKLTLNRETLVQLDQGDLQGVAGGYTPRCQYSGQQTCNTCEGVCTTNYC